MRHAILGRTFVALLAVGCLLHSPPGALAQRLQGLISNSGSLTAVDQAVTSDVGLASSAGVYVSGTWTATLAFEGTVDDTNWFAVNGISFSGGEITPTTTANGQWVVNLSGLRKFRVRVSAFTSGTATVNLYGTTGSVASLSPGTGTTTYVGTPQGRTNIKTTPGAIVSVFAYNVLGVQPCAVNFYNATAANVTLGTTVPRLAFGMTASGNTIMFQPAVPVEFTTAISVATQPIFASDSELWKSTTPCLQGMPVTVTYR